MSVSVRVRVPALALLGKTKEEIRNGVPRALNQTAIYGRTFASRQIVDKFGGRIGALKSRLALSRASISNPIARISATGKKINWIYFDARQVSEGVSVKYKGSRKVLPHAFIATLRGGNRFVVRRMKDSKHVSRKISKAGPELKIQLLSGPSVPNMFRTTIGQDHLSQLLADRFPIELEEAVRVIRFKRRRSGN